MTLPLGRRALAPASTQSYVLVCRIRSQCRESRKNC